MLPVWDDDEDKTIVRGRRDQSRHQSDVIPAVTDETSHVRPTDRSESDDDREEISEFSFLSRTVVMDAVTDTPPMTDTAPPNADTAPPRRNEGREDPLRKKTLRVTKEELFANTAPVEWLREQAESLEQRRDFVESVPRPPAPLEPAPVPRTPTESFVDEVSQGSSAPASLPLAPTAIQPTIGELPIPPDVVLTPPVTVRPSSGRRRGLTMRARVAAAVCLVVAVTAAVVGALSFW